MVKKTTKAKVKDSTKSLKAKKNSTSTKKVAKTKQTASAKKPTSVKKKSAPKKTAKSKTVRKLTVKKATTTKKKPTKMKVDTQSLAEKKIRAESRVLQQPINELKELCKTHEKYLRSQPNSLHAHMTVKHLLDVLNSRKNAKAKIDTFVLYFKVRGEALKLNINDGHHQTSQIFLNKIYELLPALQPRQQHAYRNDIHFSNQRNNQTSRHPAIKLKIPMGSAR